MDGERARVDVADRVDQADHPARAAQVQARQRVAVGGQVEERVAGQHLLAAGRQPVVELPLLAAVGCSSSQTSAPRRTAAAGSARSCAPNRSAIAMKSSSWLAFCLVTTTEILKPGTRPRQVLHRPQRGGVRARPRTASLTSAVAPSSEICDVT